MYPLIESKNPIVIDEDVDELEKIIGVSLPVEYKEFLKKTNGGKPTPNIIPLHNSKIGQNLIDVHYFMGIKAPISDISKYFFSMENRIPSDLLPIAFNAGGDIICIGWKGERLNKIYIWWHEFEAEEQDYPNYDNIDLVANSFNEFINNFSEYNES